MEIISFGRKERPLSWYWMFHSETNRSTRFGRPRKSIYFLTVKNRHIFQQVLLKIEFADNICLQRNPDHSANIRWICYKLIYNEIKLTSYKAFLYYVATMYITARTLSIIAILGIAMTTSTILTSSTFAAKSNTHHHHSQSTPSNSTSSITNSTNDSNSTSTSSSSTHSHHHGSSSNHTHHHSSASSNISTSASEWDRCVPFLYKKLHIC